MSKSNVRDSYDRLAEEYDERWSKYIDRSIDETLNRLPVEPGMRVLDVGCGTGVLLERLLGDQPKLDAAGIDLSPGMLDIAEQRLSGEVRLERGDAAELPFDDGSFDLVVSTSVFHYIDRPHQALREMHRVLADGASAVITDWCADFWIMRLVSLGVGWTDPAHYRTYNTGELVDHLRDAGFEDIDVDRYKLMWYWGMMTAIAHT